MEGYTTIQRNVQEGFFITWKIFCDEKGRTQHGILYPIIPPVRSQRENMHCREAERNNLKP